MFAINHSDDNWSFLIIRNPWMNALLLEARPRRNEVAGWCRMSRRW